MAPILDFQTRYDQRNASYRSSQKDNLDDIVELSSSASHNSNKGSPGGGNMSEYVTHEELNHVEDNLRHEIKESKLELTGSIKDTKNELNSSISDLSGKIDKLSSNIDTKFANQKVWLIATTITVVSAGVGILSYIMNLMINH